MASIIKRRTPIFNAFILEFFLLDKEIAALKEEDEYFAKNYSVKSKKAVSCNAWKPDADFMCPVLRNFWCSKNGPCKIIQRT